MERGESVTGRYGTLASVQRLEKVVLGTPITAEKKKGLVENTTEPLGFKLLN